MSASFQDKIFRTYDIRGNAAETLDNTTVRGIGRAFAEMARERSNGALRIAVGRDCRLSSPRISSALSEGLMAGGAHVIDIGVGPSPLLYFAAHHLETSGSIIVTGSHNHSADNGFKLLIGKQTIHSEDIQLLGRHARSGLPDGPGGQRSEDSLEEAYLTACQTSIGPLARPLKVVVDAGNGTGGPLAKELYTRLGCEVIELYCDMDGSFPNHHPDPTVPDNLRDLSKAVVENRADLGVAFDGDADRLGAVDGKGRIIAGDRLLLLFGADIAKTHPKAKVIGEVKCSNFVYDELEKADASPIMWKVGHSLIKAKMKEEKALLAGEMSGHFFFADRFFGFDDGIYAGARLLGLVAAARESLADMIDAQPTAYATPEIRVPADNPKETMAKISEAMSSLPGLKEAVSIDGVRVHFDDGWGLARASNTESVIVVRAEGTSEARRDEILSLIKQTIAEGAAPR